jgi:hypothetical protein
MTIQAFKRRLTELNRYLPFLPGPLNEKLGDDTLFSTVKCCVPSWHKTYIRSNARAMIATMDELIDYYEALEEQESNNRDRQSQNNLQNAVCRNNNFNRSDNSSSNRDNRNANNQTSTQHQLSNRNRGSVWCDYHKTSTHDNRDCWAQQRQRNEENDTSDRKFEKNENQPRHHYYTRSQARIVASNNNEKRKEHHQHQENNRNPKDDAKSKASSDDSSSNESLYAMMEENTNQQTIIQSKVENLVPELILGILTKVTPPEYKYLRALIDSGSSRSILSAASLPIHMQSIIKDDKDGSITWSTRGGTFETKQITSVIFQLTEFASQQHFLHTFKVDCTNKSSTYNIIMGRDLFKMLKLDLKWSSTIPLITLSDHQVNMKPRGFWTRTNIQNLLQLLTHSSKENYKISTQEISSASNAQQIDKNILKFPTTTDEVKTQQIVSTLHAKEPAKISQTTTNTNKHASQEDRFKANIQNKHGRELSISTVPHQYWKTNHTHIPHHDSIPRVITLPHSLSHSAISTKNEYLTKCDKNRLADMIDKETISKFSIYRF